MENYGMLLRIGSMLTACSCKAWSCNGQRATHRLGWCVWATCLNCRENIRAPGQEKTGASWKGQVGSHGCLPCCLHAPQRLCYSPHTI
jgi:hypothetical protein